VDGGTLRCELVHGRKGVLTRESVVQRSDLFTAAEVREVEGKDKSVNTLLSLATAVDRAWLSELFPDDLQSDAHVYFDATARRVYAEEQLKFRQLPVETRKLEPPPLEPAARLLAEEVVAGRLKLNAWDHAVEQWILRLNFLSRHCPELGLQQMTEDDRRHVIAELCHTCFTYREIKDKPVWPVVKSWLGGAQQGLLDKHAPERLSLPNGKTPKVVYDSTNPPHIAMRIQELYDVNATPRIAMGKVPVLVHVLAPNMRPVQITQDLSGFWRDQYPKVKQELQRKYPKHNWR
jgi:ATP-dependent helicase HrpB